MQAIAKLMAIAVFAAMVPAMGGCPQGQPSDADDGNGGISGDGSGGGGSDVGDDGGSTAGGAKTGIRVTTPDGAETALFDVYGATGTGRLEEAQGSGEIVELPPGAYLLTEWGAAEFVYAASVVVVAGEITDVPLGAVRVTTPEGTPSGSYDIYDDASDTLLVRPADLGAIRPVPAGTYRIRDYFNEAFTYAEGVVVVAGEVSTVPLGAIHVVSVNGEGRAPYDVYDESGQNLLDRPSPSDELRPAPAGTFVLREYFNDAFVYAGALRVEAGQVTELRLGAIVYNGAEPSYDIYDASGNTLLARPSSRGETRHVPAGTYVLKDYFADTVLAAGVVVEAGAVTNVP